eukprot:Opistho-2@55930
MAARSFLSRFRLRLPSAQAYLSHPSPPIQQLGWASTSPSIGSFSFRAPHIAPTPFQLVAASGRRTLATLIEPSGHSLLTRSILKPMTFSRVVARAFGGRLVSGAAAVGLAACLSFARSNGIYARESEATRDTHTTIQHEDGILSDRNAIVSRTSVASVLMAPLCVADELNAVRVERRVLSDRVASLKASESSLRAGAVAASDTIRTLQSEIDALRSQLDAERKRFRDREKNLECALHDACAASSCVVCLDEPRNVVFECGHHVACEGCSERLSRCPMCRSDIGQRFVHYVT